ncbi:MAG: hypothetical protein QOH13_1202, partial [Thermoleophilaceae bacterium]|nr:hypothetical protein [Thermoleophilaceae bacterium]
MGGASARRAACLTVLGALVLVLLPSAAFAVVPENEMAGTSSKWYSGSLLQQSGNNCSIIGGSYSETMVSAIASYGGAPNGQVVHVGDRYYASVLISIPGNPCGSGSAFVGTDVVLPRGTSVDTSAPIRCFGQPRNANTFVELTGGNWSFTFANGNTSTGPYCPDQVSGSLTGTPGAVGVGYRPLASGQLYQIFVPIKSTDTLQGIGHSPTDEIRWVLSSSGTYDNTGATYVWANVFPAGNGNTPFIYFARDPSVVPFWDASAPSAPQDERNKVEWFANLYSAGKAGSLCWTLYNDSPPNTFVADCTTPGGWNSAVDTSSDSWQVVGTGASAGPNGGYV